MSNFNYMDNVPVKIAEKYKPPPRIYQIPQSVTNKLNLPDGYYYDAPQFSYDFQLERKVLSKIPEYRRKRQIERDARQERKEKREKEQQRKIEEQHKRMLGAVNYPNAEELSSSEDNDDDSDRTTERKNSAEDRKAFIVNKDVNWLSSYSFNNILQPTVVVMAQNGEPVENNMDDTLSQSQYFCKSASSSSNTELCSSSNNLANTFNYKDFEDDTSSPFDNIELKTINDLDILRQVLHNTQLKTNKEDNDIKDSNSVPNNLENNVEITENAKENYENYEETLTTSTVINDAPQIVSDISTIENTKAALEKVNFSDINIGLDQQLLQTNNIPTLTFKSNNYYSRPDYRPTIGTTALQPFSASYTQHYSNGVQDQPNYQALPNNYIFSSNCNSNVTLSDKKLNEYNNFDSTPNTLAHQMHYVFKNANNLPLVPTQLNDVALYNVDTEETLEEDIQSTKSRSVPDLFQELRDEVHNSEMRRRRSRNYSHNFDGSREFKDEEENDKSPKEDCISTKIVTEKLEDTLETFKKLTPSAKILARNISSMGFPLGRVARISQIYGEDDKKIVEHLIPLTELLDLGFDETKITEALLKFDNNKEKALEHLIT